MSILSPLAVVGTVVDRFERRAAIDGAAVGLETDRVFPHAHACLARAPLRHRSESNRHVPSSRPSIPSVRGNHGGALMLRQSVWGEPCKAEPQENGRKRWMVP